MLLIDANGLLYQGRRLLPTVPFVPVPPAAVITQLSGQRVMSSSVA